VTYPREASPDAKVRLFTEYLAAHLPPALGRDAESVRLYC
jgi:hypothetical protein